MAPVTKAVNAAISTAAADISFISLTCGCRPGEMKSMIFSIAVLNISADHTKPVTSTSIRISLLDKLKYQAPVKTIQVATR